ncbi:MAG: adenosylcobinamide-phosphate synthase CbiB [Synergistaceae bacterium]|nr:adenosylcobinamide-phosphate synthase CbiB [Synergistaceae bacterium]
MYLLAAVFLDALFGDPKRLPHPVGGVGLIIRFWEKFFYRKDDKKRGGTLFCRAVLATTAAAVGLVLLAASFASPVFYGAAVLYLLYSALAWRSLKDETLPVAVSLFNGDIPRAREELSRVVGRDVQSLDEAGIIRAAVETIGENFIDGVFSALFFAAAGYAIGGPAVSVMLTWLFKAVNTMDSMVGYDNERYRDFGRACAKLDDALNFIPARLGGIVALLAGVCLGYAPLRGLKVFLRDRKKHKSPNSAHGESAFAGLLGIRLGGGASYGGVFEAKPEIGDNLREPDAADILRAHSVLDASVALCVLILLCL